MKNNRREGYSEFVDNSLYREGLRESFSFFFSSIIRDDLSLRELSSVMLSLRII